MKSVLGSMFSRSRSGEEEVASDIKFRKMLLDYKDCYLTVYDAFDFRRDSEGRLLNTFETGPFDLRQISALCLYKTMFFADCWLIRGQYEDAFADEIVAIMKLLANHSQRLIEKSHAKGWDDNLKISELEKLQSAMKLIELTKALSGSKAANTPETRYDIIERMRGYIETFNDDKFSQILSPDEGQDAPGAAVAP